MTMTDIAQREHDLARSMKERRLAITPSQPDLVPMLVARDSDDGILAMCLLTGDTTAAEDAIYDLAAVLQPELLVHIADGWALTADVPDPEAYAGKLGALFAAGDERVSECITTTIGTADAMLVADTHYRRVGTGLLWQPTTRRDVTFSADPNEWYNQGGRIPAALHEALVLVPTQPPRSLDAIRWLATRYAIAGHMLLLGDALIDADTATSLGLRTIPLVVADVVRDVP
jgi:hypothetical protein